VCVHLWKLGSFFPAPREACIFMFSAMDGGIQWMEKPWTPSWIVIRSHRKSRGKIAYRTLETHKLRSDQSPVGQKVANRTECRYQIQEPTAAVHRSLDVAASPPTPLLVAGWAWEQRTQGWDHGPPDDCAQRAVCHCDFGNKTTSWQIQGHISYSVHIIKIH